MALPTEDPPTVAPEGANNFLEKHGNDKKKTDGWAYLDDTPNLVEEFQAHQDGVDCLKEIADKVCRDFDTDYEGSTERRSQFKKDWAIFAGTLPDKAPPFQGLANPHVPIAIENLTRNTMRAYAELFGDWNNVFGVSPMGPDDEKEAQLLTHHGNWQLRQQIPDFQRQMARGMLIFFFLGDVSCHSYWNQETEQNRHEVLTLDEFVIPYVYTSTMPDYSDVPHRTLVQYKYKHEIEHNLAWANVDKLFDKNIPSLDDDPVPEIAEELSRDKGVEPEVSDKVAPFKILSYEGWLDLPNQDKERFCKVVLDYKTRTVLELMILEQPDWQDQQRFDQQQTELDEYRTQMDAYLSATQQQQMALQQTTQMAMAAAPEMGQQQSAVVQQGLAEAQAVAAQIQPPAPPAWTVQPDLNPDTLEAEPKDPNDPGLKPSPVKRKPIHLFAHGVLIEPLVGGIGLGYGNMQCDFNRAANISLSAFVDQAGFANLGSYISSDIVEWPEPLAIVPGGITRVTGVTGEELAQNIIPLKFPPANPQLVEVVKMMSEFGSSSMQSPQVLSGEPGKSGETKGGIVARIEQATKQLSVSTRTYSSPFLVQILRNNALLNSVNLKDEEFFHVALTKGAIPEMMKIGRRMYERNYHVEIRADLRFVSQSQRVEEANAMLEKVMQMPQLQMNQAFSYMCMRKWLEAQDRADMVQLLGEMPPAPQFWGMPSPPPPPVQMMLEQQQQMAQQSGAPPGGPPQPGAPPPNGGPPPGPQGPPQPGPPHGNGAPPQQPRAAA